MWHWKAERLRSTERLWCFHISRETVSDDIFTVHPNISLTWVKLPYPEWSFLMMTEYFNTLVIKGQIHLSAWILMSKTWHWRLVSGSRPRWEKLTSGYHYYPLKGLNLRYMYCSQNHFSEYIEIYRYKQQKVVFIFICLYFINFGFKVRYMYC